MNDVQRATLIDCTAPPVANGSAIGFDDFVWDRQPEHDVFPGGLLLGGRLLFPLRKTAMPGVRTKIVGGPDRYFHDLDTIFQLDDCGR